MELDHLAALETLCRVCGGRLEQFKQSFQCSDKRSTERLASVDVVTADDDPRVHPPTHLSWMLPETGKEKDAKEKGRAFHSEINVFSWVVHSDTACTSCDQYKHAHTLTTGRKQKGKSPFWGRPRTSKAIAYIRDIAPSSHRPKNGTHEYLLPSLCLLLHTCRPRMQHLHTDLRRSGRATLWQYCMRQLPLRS